jgi:hypothetical protein
MDSGSNFLFGHININSIHNKFEEVKEILNKSKVDVLLVNETKLGASTPDGMFQHNDYLMFRNDRKANHADRDSRGGGVMVFIKRNNIASVVKHNHPFEFISFKLKVKSQTRPFGFICAYKPPSVTAPAFLSYLDTVVGEFDPGDDIFIAGDLNMNLNDDSSDGDPLREFCAEHKFSNFVQSPTRTATRHDKKSGDSTTTANILDVVLHNHSSIKRTSVIDWPVSDHAIVLTECNFVAESLAPLISFGRKCNKLTMEAIQQEFIESSMAAKLESAFDGRSTPNDCWSQCSNALLLLLDKHAPIKKINVRRKESVMWYDGELHRKNKLMAKCYKEYLVAVRAPNGDAANRKAKEANVAQRDIIFKTARSDYQSTFRKKMIAYFERKNASSFSSSKQFWEFYAASVGTKRSSTKSLTSITVERDGAVAGALSIKVSVDDPVEVLEEASKHLASISPPKDAMDIMECSAAVLRTFQANADVLTKKNSSQNGGNFDYHPTTEVIMLKFLNALDETSSAGFTGIPTKLLKALAPQIAPFLVALFNLCVETSTFPDDFKVAIVTPLYKNKGSIDDLNSYRGISALPPIAKVFEKILAEQTRIYFDVNKLFFTGQHGFRAAHSCESALHELVSKCNDAQEGKLINLLLFVDFKKAFDMLDARLLLIKLGSYGFSTKAILLIKNYFEQRRQKVKIGANQSAFADITLGVPQGSVLGPLFFLIFINDLPAYLGNIYTKLFADDTTMLFNGSSIEQCVAACKVGVKLLIEWCEFNRLYINWAKTFVMFASNKNGDVKHEMDDISSISVNGIEIKAVSTFRLLGVTLDNKLNFVQHAAEVAQSATSKMFALKRIFYLSREVRINFFKTFVLPCFDFGLSLIIYFSKTAIDKITKAFYKCIFHIFKIDCSVLSIAEINKALFDYKLTAFQSRVFVKLASFAFQMKFLPHAPTDLKEQLCDAAVRHDYVLRQSSLNFIEPDGVKVTKPGQLTFKFFFSNLLNKHKLLQSAFNIYSHIDKLILFKKEISRRLDDFVNSFLLLHDKFSMKDNLNFFCSKTKDTV